MATLEARELALQTKARAILVPRLEIDFAVGANLRAAGVEIKAGVVDIHALWGHTDNPNTTNIFDALSWVDFRSRIGIGARMPIVLPKKNSTETILVRTHQDRDRVLRAGMEGRLRAASEQYLLREYRAKRRGQIGGTIPVYDAAGNELTGEAAVTAREAIAAATESPPSLADLIVPTDIDELKTFRGEDLSEVALARWASIVDAQEEHDIHAPPASDAQATAQRTLARARQDGVIAIRRARTVTAVNTAWAAAVMAIEAVTPAGVPEWVMESGNALTLNKKTKRLHVDYDGNQKPSWSYEVLCRTRTTADDATLPTAITVEGENEFSVRVRWNQYNNVQSVARIEVAPGVETPTTGLHVLTLTGRNLHGPTTLTIQVTVPTPTERSD